MILRLAQLREALSNYTGPGTAAHRVVAHQNKIPVGRFDGLGTSVIIGSGNYDVVRLSLNMGNGVGVNVGTLRALVDNFPPLSDENMRCIVVSDDPDNLTECDLDYAGPGPDENGAPCFRLGLD